MSLCNIYEWQLNKTVKLTDTYVVFIQMTPESELVALPECTNVSLPNYKYKEEIYRYGNTEKLFLIPDYSGLEDLSLEFVENYRDDEDEFSKLRIQDIVNICLNKLYTPIITTYNDASGNNVSTAGYRHTDTIRQIIVRVYKNNFEIPLLDYVFTDLKLTDYSSYELNYSTADLLKWNLKFAYQGYYVVDSPEEKPEDTYNEVTMEAGKAKAAAELEVARAGRGPASARNPVEDRENAIKAKQGAKDRRDDAWSEIDNEIASLEGQRAELEAERERLTGKMLESDIAKSAYEAYLTTLETKAEAEENLAKRKEEIAQSERKKVDELERNLEEKRNSGDMKPEDIEILEEEFNEAKNSLDKNIKKAQAADADIKKLENDVKMAENATATAKKTLKEAEASTTSNYKLIQDRLEQIELQLNGKNGIIKKIEAAKVEKTKINKEYNEQIKVLDDQIARFESKIPKGTELRTEGSILSDAETRSQQEHANRTAKTWQSNSLEQLDEAEKSGLMTKEDKEKVIAESIRSETGVGGVENVLGEITKIPDLEELELDEDDEPAPKQNTEIETEAEAETEAPAPIQQKPKAKQREITLNEEDIGKYVPILLRPLARSYFNDHKNENNTITLPADEKLLMENVPKILRGTAKEIYDKYMEDHPSVGK